MMIRNQFSKYKLFISALLLGLLVQTAGVKCYAHSFAFLPPDTIVGKQKAAQKPRVRFKMESDSIEDSNKKKIGKMNQSAMKGDTLKFDSLKMKKIFNPNPVKATWLAMLIPGGGQIYNRKYWKLPIVYGGLAGCAYALSWNNKMYKDYAQAYRDLMDNNPSTTSYKTLLPAGYTYSESQLATTLKNRKDLYRRYRDISIFSLIGVYLLSIVDAYVDAELSNFDISPDLSMHIEPVIMNNNYNNISSQVNKAVGIQCCLRF
jgi:hypothetical protein